MSERRHAVTGTGVLQKVEGDAVHKTIPAPEPGKHRWGAILVFDVNEAEILEGHANFTADRIAAGPDIGCMHCEQPYSKELAATPCPGEPTGP